MRRIISLFILLTVAAGPAVAAVFFPEDGTGVTKGVQELLAGLPAGQTEIVIGDMIFKVDDVAKSGFKGTRWTDNTVYYQFEANVTASNRVAWREGAQHWECVAGLTFIEGTGDGNYILCHSGSSNLSQVGMVGGAQNMEIYNWNNTFIISHEIGHALGLGHEHQRPDRGTYVSVDLANIQDDFEDQFNTQAMDTYGPYDFDSIMHYDACAFSIDCAYGFTCDCTHYTIQAIPPYEGQQGLMGQRTHISTLDAAGMVTRYGADTLNQPPVAVCQPYGAHPDHDCCLWVSLDDIDGGSYDPNGAGDIASIWITAVDGFDVTPTIATKLCDAGEHTVTLTITDLCGESDACDATVTLQNETPVAVGTAFSAVADDDCCISVQLSDVDGGSYDPDGMDDIATLAITALDGAPAADDQLITVCGSLVEHQVEITITDWCGATSSTISPVTVLDETPPVLTLAIDRDVLWPPNHKYVDVTTTVSATDNCDDPLLQLVRVTSDEPEDGHGDGHTLDDIVIVDMTHFQLRSERLGGGDGRVYTIVYSATDLSGNVTTDSVMVEVPHDARGWAKSYTGFSPAGTEFDPAARTFGLLIESTVAQDATQIDPERCFVGNSRGFLRPVSSSLIDYDRDGRRDLLVFYPTAGTRALRRMTAQTLGADGGELTLQDPEPIALRYELGEAGQLVLDILALGEPIVQQLGAEAKSGDGPEGPDGPDLSQTSGAVPQATAITAVKPNPFNPSTTIMFGLKADGRVRLNVYNFRGVLVRQLLDQDMTAGYHQVAWDGADAAGRPLAAGMYMASLETGGERSVCKLALIK